MDQSLPLKPSAPCFPDSADPGHPRQPFRQPLSRHAKVRCQQRGIPQSAVALISQYGDRQHDGRGGIRFLMTGRAMQKLAWDLGRDQSVDRLRGCYLVKSLDQAATIVTVGHRRR